MFSFQSLDVYKQAIRLVLETYTLTKKFPSYEQYCLTSQTNRSALSIPSNIAEGYGRITAKDRAHYLNIARSSLFELVCQMEIAYELGYIIKDQYEAFEKICNNLSIRITNFSKYIKKDN